MRKQIKEMVEATKSGLMALFMRVIGKMTKPMVEED